MTKAIDVGTDCMDGVSAGGPHTRVDGAGVPAMRCDSDIE